MAVSAMSQQTNTATKQVSVIHAVIHACYMSTYIAIHLYRDSGPWTLRTAIYWICSVLAKTSMFMFGELFDCVGV